MKKTNLILLSIIGYTSVTYAGILTDSYTPDQSYTATCDLAAFRKASTQTWIPYSMQTCQDASGGKGVTWNSKNFGSFCVNGVSLEDLRRDVGEKFCASLPGSFYYTSGAELDFNWSIEDNAPLKIEGSVFVTSNNTLASWNSLYLASGETTPSDSSKRIGLSAFFAREANDNYWIADLVYNTRRYVLLGDYEYFHGCPVQKEDLSGKTFVFFNGDNTQLFNMGITRPSEGSVTCYVPLVDMGPDHSFSYMHRHATKDFGWTVINQAPDTITGSFDVSSDGYFASWNNISLNQNQETPYDPSRVLGLGPYFIHDSNYWIFYVNYKGKKYYARGKCAIDDSDTSGVTHVYVHGDNNGLTNVLIGKPTKWCDPIQFTYFGPVSN
ncbi:MAG: hypothetical protein K0R14_2165 [Burkholderiales bacterium]|jgi:hypothetical protein|nr:hypothetical protein [Burkholderiales bacterium]